MNKIPDKINILGRTFDIIIEDMSKHANDDIGSARLSSQKIWIDSDDNIHIQEKEETLFHEVIEMINKMCELDLDHKTITILSSILYQVLSENKLSFGYTENDTVRGKEIENE